VRFSGLGRQQRTRSGWNSTSYFETVGFGCQSRQRLWKEYFVVPIFKSGDCYRRISILSAILKLFEKMVWDRVTPVVRPVISNTQHGFVKGRSIVTNLVQFTYGGIKVLHGGSLLCLMGSYLTGSESIHRSFRGSTGESFGIDIIHFGY
jgi:hypothetical protein